MRLLTNGVVMVMIIGDRAVHEPVPLELNQVDNDMDWEKQNPKITSLSQIQAKWPYLFDKKNLSYIPNLKFVEPDLKGDGPILRNIEPETAILQMFDFLRNLDVLVPLDLMIIYHEANRYGVSQFGCQFSTFHCAIPLVFIGLAACAQLTETQVKSKLKYQEIYTTSRMTSVSRYGRIQLSREERSRNDAPDHAFMHIHNRSDADADRCFGMLTWNAIRYHRKKIGFSYGYLI